MSMFFTVKRDIDSVKEATGDYINTSGIYDVIIKFVSVNRSVNGSMSLDFNCEYKGTPVTIYGLRLTNNDGSENFQAKLFNKLLVIAGLDGVSEPTIESHVVGKDKAPKEFSVITELSDLPIKMRIQYTYSLYEGKIIERREIKNFYRESDGAVASEILLGEGFGTQLEKDKKYAANITYNDGLTAETIAQWKADKKAGINTTPVNTTSAMNNAVPF
ncbi:hypothetical protein [Campylobacter vicugnae]|uniref:Phage tail protein n=1 Tax=Campylobacter vicugnae TaxID=1660076 RepID=A0ABZ2E6J2_9BACT|nr:MULTISPECIES: hypothetical protein [unclassified Campylobacter]